MAGMAASEVKELDTVKAMDWAEAVLLQKGKFSGCQGDETTQVGQILKVVEKNMWSGPALL
eukprot:4206622-Amphidinium_carterae.1